MVKNKNLGYVFLVIAVVILLVLFLNYNSSKNQETKWREENKINSVRIIDVGLINPVEMEARACSLCRTGIYLERDGTKTCSEEKCVWADVGGAMAVVNDCKLCSTSKSQEVCKGGSLKLTFNIDSKATNTLSCKVYNNGEMYPSNNETYAFNSGLNVMQYAPRDYTFSPQTYKICCKSTIQDELEVCSNEYSYVNPC